MTAIRRIIAAKIYSFRFTMEENGRSGTVTFDTDARDLSTAWTKIVKEQKNLMKYITKIELVGTK